jgi:hypothetical protein
MPFREESPLFDQLLATLEEHGARGPAGWQVHQEVLAELAGFRDKRHLYDYLRVAKEHGCVVVTANRVGEGFGNTIRQADSYHLRVSAAQWAEMRPAVVEARDKAARAKLGAKSKAAQMERSRLVRQARRAGPAAGARARAAAEAVPVDLEAAAALAASYGPDEDLAGW